MASIQEQRLDASGLYVRARPGVEVTITPAAVRAFFQTTSGSAAARRAATLQWVRDQLAPLAAYCDLSELVLDLTTGDGRVTRAEWGGE